MSAGDRDEPRGQGGRTTPSRRQFLTGGALTAAGLAVGGAAGFALGRGGGADADPLGVGAAAAHPSTAMAHIVVLMCENRSFDNLLGWLYTRETLPKGETFAGLAFGTHTNTAPDGRTVAAHVYEGATDHVMRMPDPDPGEEYPHVNTQLFGTVNPAQNAVLGPEAMHAPYNLPADADTPTMSGFITDYVNNIARKSGFTPDTATTDQVMGAFAPQMLPVLSTLAKEFAVFDHWHAAVPTQTYANRSFFHASTSHGFVTNSGGAGPSKWLDAPPEPTIFNRLEDANLDWRIYFDKAQLVSMTGIIHTPVLEKYWRTKHFAYMEDFFADVAAGTLPPYAFVEPRMIYNHNDFHPPVGVYEASVVDGTVIEDSAVSDVRAGEALVASVYDAIRTSASTSGSHALNTLLLITFDEHGGTYDHVPPPAAVPPSEDAPAGEMDFRFDRLGLRVPTIAVSAHTRAGTIIHEEMHHGALIATLVRTHGLAPLTRRDVEATDLSVALNLTTPRAADTWPNVHPAWVPANPDATLDPRSPTHSTKPLSPPARGLLGLVLAHAGRTGAAVPKTYAEAFDVLIEDGTGLFTAH